MYPQFHKDDIFAVPGPALITQVADPRSFAASIAPSGRLRPGITELVHQSHLDPMPVVQGLLDNADRHGLKAGGISLHPARRADEVGALLLGAIEDGCALLVVTDVRGLTPARFSGAEPQDVFLRRRAKAMNLLLKDVRRQALRRRAAVLFANERSFPPESVGGLFRNQRPFGGTFDAMADHRWLMEALSATSRTACNTAGSICRTYETHVYVRVSKLAKEGFGICGWEFTT